MLPSAEEEINLLPGRQCLKEDNENNLMVITKYNFRGNLSMAGEPSTATRRRKPVTAVGEAAATFPFRQPRLRERGLTPNLTGQGFNPRKVGRLNPSGQPTHGFGAMGLQGSPRVAAPRRPVRLLDTGSTARAYRSRSVDRQILDTFLRLFGWRR